MFDFVNPSFPVRRRSIQLNACRITVHIEYQGSRIHFHALNRGVDKRNIFLDDQDRARFVHDLYEFNDVLRPANTYRSFAVDKMMDLRNPTFWGVKNGIRSLISMGGASMGNHYHLLLSERVDGGLTKFIRKLNVGYANYFNEKYGVAGTLFQGRTKRIHIDSDPYFLHILHYIHLNPLDFYLGRTIGASHRSKKRKGASLLGWISMEQLP